MTLAPIAASLPQTSPRTAFRGKLSNNTLTRHNTVHFAGQPNHNQCEGSSFVKRLLLGLLDMVDTQLGRDTEHIRRVVEHVGTVDRLKLERTGTKSYVVSDTETGQKLATVKHPANSPNQLELYLGKGGFTAVVTSAEGTRYFALGKSKITLGDTEVETHGEKIISNPAKSEENVNQRYTKQGVTPQAMILGAGLATRFEPVSGEHTQRSKPDVFLNGTETVIGNIANGLAKSGFGKVFVNTYFMPASLKESLQRSDAESVTFIDEDAPSGTAGGLRKLLQDPDGFGFDPSKPVMIVQGDAVTDVDLGKLMETHQANNALVTIGCQYVDKKDVDKFGIVVTDQSDADGVSGNIQSFQEKPKAEEAKSQLANTGFSIFSPQAFPLLLEVYNELPAEQRDKELDFAKHIFPKVLAKAQQNGNGAFRAQKVDGYWSDIGNPTQYLESVYDVFAGKVNLPLPKNPDAYLQCGGVFYWPGALKAAQSDNARLDGNIVVALPYKKPL